MAAKITVLPAPVVAVSDLKFNDADRVAWTAALFDLGARYALFPPLTKPVIEDVVSGLMAAAARRAGVAAAPAPVPDDKPKPKPRKRGAHAGAAASGDAVTAPMQGTVVKVAVEEGQTVAVGDLVVVLEAMKMENPVTAHKEGVITGLSVEAGAAITQGTVLAEIK
jgi:biotin carboxyl carrier protein